MRRVKCIFVNQENSINSDLLIDGWKQEYLESMKTGKYEFKASYIGELQIGKGH